jgi:uncharacterized protein
LKQRIKTLVAGGLLALALFASAQAGPLEDAKAAADRGDYATTLRILGPMAEQGNADAQVNIGAMYANGQGVPQNYAEAVVWYRKAAEQRNANGQNDLGAMYLRGQGVPQDYVLAHMWFNLADSGASDALTREASVKDRDDVAAKMTPAQIAEAQRMASEWVQSHPPAEEPARTVPSNYIATECTEDNNEKWDVSLNMTKESAATWRHGSYLTDLGTWTYVKDVGLALRFPTINIFISMDIKGTSAFVMPIPDDISQLSKRYACTSFTYMSYDPPVPW